MTRPTRVEARWRALAFLLALSSLVLGCGQTEQNEGVRSRGVAAGTLQDTKSNLLGALTVSNQYATEVRRVAVENAAGTTAEPPDETTLRNALMSAETYVANREAAQQRVRAVTRPDAPTFRQKIQDAPDAATAVEAIGEWFSALGLWLRMTKEAGEPVAPTFLPGVQMQAMAAMQDDYDHRRRVYDVAVQSVTDGFAIDVSFVPGQ